MHLICVPLVDDRKGGQKFSSSEFVGGKDELRKLHTDFFEQVGVQFGLERGNEGSRTSHSELMQYKAWETSQRAIMDEEQAELKKRDVAIKEQEQKIRIGNEQLANNIRGFLDYEKSFESKAPVIPLPPVMSKEEDRKRWTASVQKAVTIAFRQIHTAYDVLRLEMEKLKGRLKKAEYDLAHKPLEEIRLERERQAKARQRSLEIQR